MTTSAPQNYPIRVSPVTPVKFQGGMDEMDKILDACKPDVIMTAGQTYTAAAKRLSDSAANLRAQAANLPDVWKGDDADAAVEQLGRMQKSADNMAQVALDTGNTLSNYGKQLDWYKNNRPGRGNFANLTTGDAEVFAAGTVIAGPGGGAIAVGGKKLAEAFGLIDNEEDKIAREHMDRLAERTVQANDGLPKQVTTDIPYGIGRDGVPSTPPQNPYSPGSPGSPGGPGNQNVPKNPYGNQNLPKDPYGDGGQNIPKNPYGDGNVPGSGGPGSGGQYVPKNPYGGGSGSDLAGLPGGGGGVPGGGLGSDPFGRGGVGGGIGGGGAGGGIGGGAGLGAGGIGAGMPGGMPGAGAGAGAGKGAGGRGVGGARGGAGGMAGGGGGAGRGGGKGEEETERSTWLVEDEDVWGASDGDAAPPVIS